MAKDDTEYRMLSGWKSITWGLAVIGVLAVAVLIENVRLSAAIACLCGSLSMMLLSAVLEWMGEVEHHLRMIAAEAARSVDRQNGISAKLTQSRQDSDGQ